MRETFHPLKWRLFVAGDDLKFIIILLFALVLRTVKLKYNPALYPDECNFIEFAHNIWRGEFTWGIFEHSFLPRLPLSLIYYGLFTAYFGENLLSIRMANAVLGLLTLVLLYLLLRNEKQLKFTWLCPLVYAFYPPCIYFHRWGFTYNILPPLFLSILILRLRLESTRSKAILPGMALAAGMCLISEPLGIAGWLYGLISLWPAQRRHFPRYLLGEEYHRQRCGYIDHFTRRRLKQLLWKCGFELIQMNVFRYLLIYTVCAKDQYYIG